VTPNPSFVAERSSYFDQLWAKQQQTEQEQQQQNHQQIQITLPNGNIVSGVAFSTTPLEVAKSISNGLAEAVCVAKVKYSAKLAEDLVVDCDEDLEGEAAHSHDKSDGELWDLSRPLVGDCVLTLLKFDDTEAKTVFWHSSSHILGAALENVFGAHLTIGPPLQSGFYYDAYMGTHTISEEDLKKVESKAEEICKSKLAFQRLVVSKEQALEMFKHNPFKVNLITNKVPEGSKTTVYRCGPLIDLCMGPHLPHTGKIKAFSAHKTSSTNWLGQVDNDSLQRVYGISFPDKADMKKWKEFQEAAKARDHRLLGGKQELFFFHNLSPGSAFWLPHGARIYNTLMKFIRHEYWKRGYEEVITPNMFNFDLWHISGHAAHYKEDMFVFDVEDAEFGLKPMNCPAHCLMFRHRIRSYRELPIRMADFGVLHRNEISGALTGLTRVRRFQQDDAHIFCRADQIKSEILGALDFMKFVYGLMGMTYRLQLSTRPEKYLGEVAVWDFAEQQLAEALNQFIGEGNWGLNPGDGAFYGPKIDIKVFDALDRMHQCATVQLDFQLPIRFELEYKSAGEGEEAFQRPVMVHRAMLGSVERMVAILTEHFGGKWPLWLSPRQCLVVPVDLKYLDYALEVQQKVHEAGYYVDVDDSTKTFNKKVREGQIEQYNFILVVGEKEAEGKTVNVRTRDNEVKGAISIVDCLSMFKQLVDEFK
jgi:threonyl-tRNA synthetase